MKKLLLLLLLIPNLVIGDESTFKLMNDLQKKAIDKQKAIFKEIIESNPDCAGKNIQDLRECTELSRELTRKKNQEDKINREKVEELNRILNENRKKSQEDYLNSEEYKDKQKKEKKENQKFNKARKKCAKKSANAKNEFSAEVIFSSCMSDFFPSH